MAIIPGATGPYGTPPFNPGDVSPIDRLRQGNIYNPVGAAGPDISMIEPEGVPLDEVDESATPAYDALAALMGERPDYQGPGVLQRIAASMVALNDPRLAMVMMQQPDPALTDWEAQVEAATSAAELEQTQEDLRRRRATGDVERMRAETANARLEFDRLKHETPELEIIKPESGNYKVYNPKTGEITETEFNVGDLSPEEEAELRVKTEREITGIRRERTEAEIRQRGEEQRKTVRERGEEARRTQAERPKAGGAGAVSLERRRAIANRAQEFILRNPRFKDFIDVDMSSGEVKIDPVGTGTEFWGGEELSKEEREDIINSIFGSPTDEEVSARTELNLERETPKSDPLGIR